MRLLSGLAVMATATTMLLVPPAIFGSGPRRSRGIEGAGAGRLAAVNSRRSAILSHGRARPVVLSLGRAGRRIPPGFSGLSVTYNGLSALEQEGAVFDRVIALIRPAGN